jgi:hypothetical protein
MCFKTTATIAANATSSNIAAGQPMSSHGILPPATRWPHVWQKVDVSSHWVLQAGHNMYSLLLTRQGLFHDLRMPEPQDRQTGIYAPATVPER